MKLTFLIHEKAPFSHVNVYQALQESFLEKIPEVVCMTIEDFLINPIDTTWILCLDHYKIRRFYSVLKGFARLALYVLEDPYEIDQTRELSSSEIDLLLSQDEGAIEFRRQQLGQNAYFFPLATRHTVFYPNPTPNKKYKLVLVGNAFPNRIEIVEQLSEFLVEENIEMHIFGINWQKCKRNKKIQIHMGIITEKQLAQIYNTSECTLEINRTFQKFNDDNIQALTPGRGFSSLGCECFTITDERSTSKQYFPEDGIGYYHDIEEIKEFILLSTIHKSNMAKKGNFYVKKHTYRQRVEALLEILS